MLYKCSCPPASAILNRNMAALPSENQFEHKMHISANYMFNPCMWDYLSCSNVYVCFIHAAVRRLRIFKQKYCCIAVGEPIKHKCIFLRITCSILVCGTHYLVPIMLWCLCMCYICGYPPANGFLKENIVALPLEIIRESVQWRIHVSVDYTIDSCTSGPFSQLIVSRYSCMYQYPPASAFSNKNIVALLLDNQFDTQT